MIALVLAEAAAGAPSGPWWVVIILAIIGAFGSIGAAYAANTARKDVRDRIGTPNGQGNVVEMMERLLAGQTGQDTRIARLEGVQVQHGIDLAAHDERLWLLEHPPTPPLAD